MSTTSRSTPAQEVHADEAPGAPEAEPLLGRIGSVLQADDATMWQNLIIGTAPLTQIGLLVLMVVIWTGIFSHDLILFSAHPILNSLGVIFLFESALLLQPTHTAHQKQRGTVIHSIFNAFAAAYFIAAFTIIFYNKAAHNGTHFESTHAILGLTTYTVLIVQALVGFTQYYAPAIYGGVDNAKSIYKYHRISGYLISILLLATIIAATKTSYNVGVLHIKTWHVSLAVALILLGIVPRIKKQKLGFGNSAEERPPRLE